jgi:hypothetical protein
MFVLGHVGVGRAIVGSRGRALPTIPLVLGMLLPDLIDKPLYYLHFFSLVTCSRTFGHTAIFLALVLGIGYVRRSAAWGAVGLGMATHVFLDWVLDQFGKPPSSALIALAWPLLQRHFDTFYFSSPLQHVIRIWNKGMVVSEIVGFALLVREWRSRRVTASR